MIMVVISSVRRSSTASRSSPSSRASKRSAANERAAVRTAGSGGYDLAAPTPTRRHARCLLGSRHRACRAANETARPVPASQERHRSLSGGRGRGRLVHMNTYDVIVIGGGAAGLSAALVLARARRKVLVVDAGSPRNAPAAHMHGFLSRDGLPPGELLALGRNEVENYGGEVLAGTVTA